MAEIRSNRWLYGSVIILGMLLVLFTRLIRPYLTDDQPVFTFIFGILPNFGAALAFPFFFIQITPWLFQSLTKSQAALSFPTALLLTFSGLSSWEILQFWFWQYPIDPYDILATGFGIAAAYLVHRLYSRFLEKASGT